MKILFFYQYFTTPNGSWSTRIYELTRRWVEKGAEVTVVTAPYEKSDIKASGFISRTQVDGINLIIINCGDSNRYGFLKRVFNAIMFSLVASVYSLKLRYDLVICSSGPITIGIPGLLAKWIRGKKFLFEIRDLWPAGAIEMGLIKSNMLKSIALHFERILYKNADFIVAASPGQKSFIEKHHVDAAHKIGVIPNASDNYLFFKQAYLSNEQRSGISQPHIFTHIGSLGLIHNPMFLLEVAGELKKLDAENDIAIVLIGEGAQKEELLEKRYKEDLSNVYILGIKPKKELPAWVQASVATLFTTLNNPIQDTSSPNKIFDSFAAGVPVIQTTKGWIHDLIETEGCGLNVSPDNAPEFASKMISLSQHEALRKSLAGNCLNVSQKLFDRDQLANQYLDYIKKLS